MKVLFSILLTLATIGDINKIAVVNKAKEEAKTAYLNAEYEVALAKYQFLTDSLNVIDDDISLNVANAYYHLKDTANALDGYYSLLNSKNRVVKSVAHQQLGIMSNKTKKAEEALDHFKQALRANPSNEEARYNYEMLKKALDEQKQQDQNKDNKDQQDKKDQKQDKKDQEKKDQEKKDQNKDKDQQDQKKEDQKGEDSEKQKKEEQEKQEQEKKKEEEGKEGEKDEQEEDAKESKEEKELKDQKPEEEFSKKLKEINITEEKAKMILEAMKNNEIQYFQQQKKKATKRKDSSKPDW